MIQSAAILFIILKPFRLQWKGNNFVAFKREKFWYNERIFQKDNPIFLSVYISVDKSGFISLFYQTSFFKTTFINVKDPLASCS